MTDKDLLPPQLEAKLWRSFFAQCLLVFGDKKGTFKELLSKAVDRCSITDPAAFKIALLKAIDDHEALRNSPCSGRFDVRAFVSGCDEKSEAKWSKSYPEGRVILMYHALIDPVDCQLPVDLRMNKDARPMDKREAIEEVARAFNFPSYNACYQFLKRADVKGLPPTWPK